MFKLSVLYGHPADTAAFEANYAQTHIPLALKILRPYREIRPFAA
jgi:uncharacterized protein (TIGR02118 family)